jgi:hypothetical protein
MQCLKAESYFPQGLPSWLQLVGRERSFPLGAKLVLSTRDLAEICMFYDHEARAALQSIIEFAKSLGIEIQRTTI